MLRYIIISFFITLLIKSLFKTHTIESNSMLPLIHPKDKILSLNYKLIPLKLKAENIIVFYNQTFSQLFIKRISKVYNTHYDFKSDNTNGLNSSILGKVQSKDIVSFPILVYYPINHIKVIQ